MLFSKETNYSYLAGQHDFADKLNELMERQHKSVIEQFTARIMKKQKKKPEYFDEIKGLLKKGKGEKALSVLKDSLEQYPSDPCGEVSEGGGRCPNETRSDTDSRSRRSRVLAAFRCSPRVGGAAGTI